MAMRRAGAMASSHSWQMPYSPPRRRSSASARRLARSTSRLRVAKFISRSSFTWITSTSSASWLVSPTAPWLCTEAAAPPIWRMRSTVRFSWASNFCLILSIASLPLYGRLPCSDPFIRLAEGGCKGCAAASELRDGRKGQIFGAQLGRISAKSGKLLPSRRKNVTRTAKFRLSGFQNSGRSGQGGRDGRTGRRGVVPRRPPRSVLVVDPDVARLPHEETSDDHGHDGHDDRVPESLVDVSRCGHDCCRKERQHGGDTQVAGV